VQAAAARAHKETWRLACRFRPARRYRFYRWLMTDSSGRMAQMARSCPGALIVAADLAYRSETRQTAWRLLKDIVVGRPLAELLGPATEQGASVALIRRAGHRVGAHRVLRLPAKGCVLDDIPSETNAYAAWYDVMSFVHAARVSSAFYDFASARAVELARLARRRGEGVGGPIRWLDDYVGAVGRRPSRKTSPAALIAESEVWHARQDCIVIRHGLETPLPSAPFVPWTTKNMCVRALATVGELIEEGQQMHHCVAAHVEDVLAGQAFVYSLNVEGQRLTAELREANGGWIVFDLRRRANDPPTPRERELVDHWLAEHPERKRSDATLGDHH
jgi:hypothetical protein